MTPRERVAAVYAGQVPDQVPLLLDLSHWYKRQYNRTFDLAGYTSVEEGLVKLHHEIGAICYVEMGSFYDLSPDSSDILFETSTSSGVFTTRIKTPIGTLHEERI